MVVAPQVVAAEAPLAPVAATAPSVSAAPEPRPEVSAPEPAAPAGTTVQVKVVMG